uniref:Uncharacterized protein n=1 Tax=Anguilla anguilla TaxID=7936 RepID=A0A0E9PP92_ANGAN
MPINQYSHNLFCTLFRQYTSSYFEKKLSLMVLLAFQFVDLYDE